MSSNVTPKATTQIKITASLFEAGLKCLTKCFLLSLGENGPGNAYANWTRFHNESYQAEAIERLTAGTESVEYATGLADAKNLTQAEWRLATDLTVAAQNMGSTIPVVERVSERQGESTRFVPMRFVYTNKLTPHDKLLVAFDAVVLTELLGREIDLARVVHGDNRAKTTVRTASLVGKVRKMVARIAKLLSSQSPHAPVLRRHCDKCQFEARCRQNAKEKEDLSLLAGMSEKERKEYNSKGIFTVTQLSYTFRPRRRPKRFRDKRERYHHSLKALAIRENKIHVIGNPEVNIEGTPVYLDVEALPDRDSYYLIGMRIRKDGRVVQHSLWADSAGDEKMIWIKFLDILSTTEDPVLIHYGSFEATFLKRMLERYGGRPNGLDKAVNLLSVIYGQVYFPVFSNGLKDVAGRLGFNWTDTDCSGLLSIAWRHRWEDLNDESVKEKLLRYNAQDCEALEVLTGAVRQIGDAANGAPIAQAGDTAIVRVDSDTFLQQSKWKRFTSPVSSLEYVNAAAHWDYQRDRVYARSGKVRQKAKTRLPRRRASGCVEKVVIWERSQTCPRCGRSFCIKYPDRARTLHEILYGRRSLKLRFVKYIFPTCLCRKCGATFGMPDRFRISYRYGWNLFAYLFYQVTELGIPQRTVMESFNRLFGFDLSRSTLSNLKSRTAEYYAPTKQQILERLLRGSLIHVDETRANIKGKSAFVWILASFHEVVYFLSESREGEFAHNLLADYKGVLVSDFYTAYDSLDCPQQKCLIHLIRDLNDQVLVNPFDEQLKQIVARFGDLLKPIIETVDRYGLKKHFLRRHVERVDGFYRQLTLVDCQSEASVKCRERFERNRDTLFTFLKCDGVPWNNNNAEHAVKAFAKLRNVISGTSTAKGIDEYLTLLNICQTRKYSGVDFLDFMSSGERDIWRLGASRRLRRV